MAVAHDDILIQEVTEWMMAIESTAKGNMPVDSGELLASFRGRVKLDFGIPEAVVYTLRRHGIMVEKGVGRGHGIESVGTNGAALQGRTPQEWFSSALTEAALAARASR